MTIKVSLSSCFLTSTVQRRGIEAAIIVRPGSNAKLLNTDLTEKAELVFTQGGRFIVQGADGRRTAVNFDFGKNPPRPVPAQQDQFVADEQTSAARPPTAPIRDDEWGLK